MGGEEDRVGEEKAAVPSEMEEQQPAERWYEECGQVELFMDGPGRPSKDGDDGDDGERQEDGRHSYFPVSSCLILGIAS